MARYRHIKVGKPFSVDELKKPRLRNANPRDAELELLVNEVSIGPASQVWPMELGDAKLSTARAAANRAIKRTGAKVFVGVHRDYPQVLLFSRSRISNRGRKRAS